MKIFKILLFLPVMTGLLATTSQLNATPVLLDFEDISDFTSVGDFYASTGVHFYNAISLTAGFSLNEYDFPPHSGLMAIGDNYAPIEIFFEHAANNINAYFTYSSQLTFSAYDSSGNSVGWFINQQTNNLQTSDLIALSFSNVSRLTISGASENSYIMDDFSFEPGTPVPEPSTILLFVTGLSGLVSMAKRKGKQTL